MAIYRRNCTVGIETIANRGKKTTNEHDFANARVSIEVERKSCSFGLERWVFSVCDDNSNQEKADFLVCLMFLHFLVVLSSSSWCLISLLIPLNVCRRKHNYLPWECEHERHTYEK